jgi:hypothetical protein
MEVAQTPQQGYFSLLRWRHDATRDEARNVAVMLVEEKGGFSAFQAAALSRISPSLHEQGLLDAALNGLREQFEAGFTLERLTALEQSLHRSLYITTPKRVAVPDVEQAVGALYRAYVAPRGGGGRRLTKGAVLDRVVDACRKQGFKVRRGAYLDDYIFDAIIQRGRTQQVLEVLSFAAVRKDWSPIERDAGHFLFALQQLKVSGLAVIAPPTEASLRQARKPYERVRRWLDRFDVPIHTPEDIIKPQTQLDVLKPG